MEFDSPDVEKEFPGLYSSASARKANDSDFSDESHEKSFKSDLIGKRKDKKDSKKDRGYAALEGESSPDEGDSKSPSKSKKTKSFKFPVKKSEKREKSRDKEGKEKELEREKRKEKEKKDKSKPKEKKKEKNKPDDVREADENGVFGVRLSTAVERLGCLDGVGIPLPVRLCIDCITATGLAYEGLYKPEKGLGVKSRVAAMRKKFNARETVSAAEMDVPLAAAVLLTFLREMPDPILTSDLITRFEEAGAISDAFLREENLRTLVEQLPQCNRDLLAWLIVHFDQVTQHEKQNKINAQWIAMTYSPVLQMSHRLLTALLCHCRALFPDTDIVRYVAPLPPGSSFPDNPTELAAELRKQEALLNQIHRDMNDGFVSEKREELLWEVQRVVTQLKRKLKGLHKSQEASIAQKSIDEEQQEDLVKKKSEDAIVNETVQPPEIPVAKQETVAPQPAETKPYRDQEASSTEKTEQEEPPPSLPAEPIPAPKEEVAEPQQQSSDPLSWEEVRLQLEHAELLQLQTSLQQRLDHERRLASRFRTLIHNYRGFIDSESEDSSAESTPAFLSPETEARMEQLLEENQRLTQKRDDLMRAVMDEREACMKLNVCINYYEQRYERQGNVPA